MTTTTTTETSAPVEVISAKKRQSLQMEQEAKSFASQQSNYPRRSKAMTPTYEEIQSTSFTEYVQHALFDEEDSDDEAGGENTRTNSAPATEEQIRNRKIRFTDGVVKITLPKGWWDEAGIGKDRTARGPAWQEGTPLGDMDVKGPIKQQIAGIGGVYEYALFDSPAMTLSEYRVKADEYRKGQLGHRASKDHDDKKEYLDDKACDDLARQFWRRLGPTTPPSIYGADMEGSLFDGDKASGWSLQGLDNCLQLLSAASCEGMPGVTTPYLYVGMWGSVFCAHTEDMNLLSINYLHAGAPKYWYAIAPEHAARFESLAESHFVHAFRDCPQFLRHKQTMISPAILKKAGVPFQVQIQRPGDAIITCPGAYHFGVNLGFNVAEATNFAIPEWIPKGREAKVCMCRPHSVFIDVDRFSDLLKKYEQDTDNATQLGFPRLEYLRWTMIEASRKKLAATAKAKALLPQPVASTSNGTKQTKKGKKSKKSTKAAPPPPPVTIVPAADLTTDGVNKAQNFWVEVMRPLNESGKGRNVTKKSNGSKKRKKSLTPPTEIEYLEEWRLAKPQQSKKPLKLDTNVLCLLPGKKEGDEGEDVEDEECFAGVVVETVDDHCRVHFAGLKKEEDVWMSMSSDKLFLDGGKWVAPPKVKTPPQPPAAAKNKASPVKKKSPAAKNNKTKSPAKKVKSPAKKPKAPVKKKLTPVKKKKPTVKKVSAVKKMVALVKKKKKPATAESRAKAAKAQVVLLPTRVSKRARKPSSKLL